MRIQNISSDRNSISIHSINKTITIRKDNGEITTEINNFHPLVSLIKIIIVSTIIRELSFLFLPKLCFHAPTIVLMIIWSITMLYYSHNITAQMMHGAEHKVLKYFKDKKSKNIKCYSRIDLCCGTNLLSTLLTFQLMASICYIFWNFHIPEVITIIMPFITYRIIPFNFLGIISQILFTTKEPKNKYINMVLELVENIS